jgi:hypothetical protein
VPSAHAYLLVDLFDLAPAVADTQNEPHEEAKKAGDDTQYLSIQVLRNLIVPDLAALRAVQSLPKGTGRCQSRSICQSASCGSWCTDKHNILAQ